MPVYNLTAHLSHNNNKRIYCAVWHEKLSGRSGNDIASGTTTIIGRILKDFPGITKLILWFDSCVPQNRNSHMSVALREVLVKNPNLSFIQQTFCEPGHSAIQEVDNAHSQIERALSSMEIFSPLGLVRSFITVNRNNTDHSDSNDGKRLSKLCTYCAINAVPHSTIL